MRAPVLKGTSGVNTPLVDFNMIFDLDYTIIVVVYKYYLDTNIFNKELFDTIYSVRDLVKLCINRKEVNPLYIIANENIDRTVLDDLYNQFLTDPQSLKEIEDNLMITKFYELLAMFKSSGDINTTILYHNDFEKKILDKYPITASISKVHIDKVNCKDYNQFYIKYGCKTDKYKISNPLEKISNEAEETTIYIANYPFNKITTKTNENMFEIVSASLNEFIERINDKGNLIRFTGIYDMRDVYYDEYMQSLTEDEEEDDDED